MNGQIPDAFVRSLALFARGQLREALELARRCGAAGLAKRAFDELAATGEHVRHHTPG